MSLIELRRGNGIIKQNTGTTHSQNFDDGVGLGGERRAQIAHLLLPNLFQLVVQPHQIQLLFGQRSRGKRLLVLGRVADRVFADALLFAI